MGAQTSKAMGWNHINKVLHFLSCVLNELQNKINKKTSVTLYILISTCPLHDSFIPQSHHAILHEHTLAHSDSPKRAVRRKKIIKDM